MQNEKLSQLILEAAEYLDLDEAVVEKDYYVTQAIQSLSGIEDDYFRLVFAGGTCLAKAHKIVKRMSEDVDFKIQFKSTEEFSKSRMLKELKKFRTLITSKLNIDNIIADAPIVRNEGQYTRSNLTYLSSYSNNDHLRPHILLEFTLSKIRLPTETLYVKTMIEDAFENVNISTPRSASCISINETAIEKWVGLTRRVIAIERGYHRDDETLIRHVYDLNAIIKNNRMTDDFLSQARNVINNDAKQFKNQHPEYSADPRREIEESLNLLQNKKVWHERYDNFIETMVYDRTNVPEYDSAIQSLKNISAEVFDAL